MIACVCTKNHHCRCCCCSLGRRCCRETACCCCCCCCSLYALFGAAHQHHHNNTPARHRDMLRRGPIGWPTDCKCERVRPRLDSKHSATSPRARRNESSNTCVVVVPDNTGVPNHVFRPTRTVTVWRPRHRHRCSIGTTPRIVSVSDLFCKLHS